MWRQTSSRASEAASILVSFVLCVKHDTLPEMQCAKLDLLIKYGYCIAEIKYELSKSVKTGLVTHVC